MKLTCLVTGCAGFIGSNFTKFLLEKNPDFTIVGLDKMTYAASPDVVANMSKSSRFKFVKGDICDQKLVESLFSEYQFQGVFHFAAESHVDNSINGPEVFVDTNIKGTFVLLEAARKLWLVNPHQPAESFRGARFHHVSTDEVYGSLGDEGYFTEETPYAPNSPYSASKAASDFLVRSYHHTYGMNTTISNCSNNYGPFQHDEKLIPTVIRSALFGRTIPIYGDGKNVRDWLYVSDHCDAIWTIFSKSAAGETYNIGAHNEQDNISLAVKICEMLDHLVPRDDGASYKTQIKYVSDRPGHDRRYAIDNAKIIRDFGWHAKFDFEAALSATLNWYIQKYRLE